MYTEGWYEYLMEKTEEVVKRRMDELRDGDNDYIGYDVNRSDAADKYEYLVIDDAKRQEETYIAFKKELECLINRHSIDNDLDTPDFILTDYIMMCIANFKVATLNREGFFGR